MKLLMTTGALLALANLAANAIAQPFSSGSDGSYGPLNITVSTNLNMPANGIFKCSTINIAKGVTVGFNRNPLNTPVYLLATGDVLVAGSFDLSGASGSFTPPLGGLGGPGGFDGGQPGIDISSIPPGAGYGPGAGRGGVEAGNDTTSAGAAGYAARAAGPSTNAGAAYGSPLLIPLIGGSGGGGGGGSPGRGGGGGGGAILIASNTRIQMDGVITATGGTPNGNYNGGSGGAIRLVAPIVQGTGELHVEGGVDASFGRIRIDTLDRSGLGLAFNPSSAVTVGAGMFVFPDPIPRLDIIAAAGTTIPEGTANAVTVVLPFGSSPSRTITVQARNFTGVVPINVVLTPENGTPSTYSSQIDMSKGNPASASVDVVFPVNVRTVVNAWTH